MFYKTNCLKIPTYSLTVPQETGYETGPLVAQTTPPPQLSGMVRGMASVLNLHNHIRYLRLASSRNLLQFLIRNKFHALLVVHIEKTLINNWMKETIALICCIIH